MAIPLVYGALAAYQVYSGAQQASAIQRQAQLQQQLDQFNIEQAELDSFNAERDGYTEMARYQTAIDEIEASSRVQYIAAGVDPNFGTARELQEQNSLVGALNLMDIQSQAQQRALGYKKEINQRRGQSAMNMLGAELQSSSIRNASYVNAANTMLTGYERNKVPSEDKITNRRSGHFAVNFRTNEKSYNYAYGGALGDIA